MTTDYQALLRADASPPMIRLAGQLPVVDLLKVVASQGILWHHFALYGPMAYAWEQMMPGLHAVLVEHGRLWVQVFLVVAGFLAARSLLFNLSGRSVHWGLLVRKRMQRLLGPYAIALLAALVVAAVVRSWSPDATTPAVPNWGQLLAHALLLQDVLGYEGLSAGVWYVAIDLQLYALLAALALLGVRRALLLSALLTLASLLFFNRYTHLDAWALYFWSSYGLGVMAYWLAVHPSALRRRLLGLGLGLLLLLALWLAWRVRVALAAVVAALLWLSAGRSWPALARRPWLRWLSDISYEVFLLHYSVLMLVGAAVQAWWPGQHAVAGIGLLLAWGLTLWLADRLHRWLNPGRA